MASATVPGPKRTWASMRGTSSGGKSAAGMSASRPSRSPARCVAPSAKATALAHSAARTRVTRVGDTLRMLPPSRALRAAEEPEKERSAQERGERADRRLGAEREEEHPREGVGEDEERRAEERRGRHEQAVIGPE